jgi:hypothetical protein
MTEAKEVIEILTNFQLFRVFDFQLAEPQKAMESESYMMFRDQGPVLRVTERDIQDFKPSRSRP